MDLNEISAEQALIDLGVANARIVDLSCQIELASLKVLRLRQELERLQRNDKPISIATVKQAAVAPAVWWAPLSKLMRRRVKTSMLIHIDEICGRPLASQGDAGTYVVSSREFRSLTISGWAVPRNFPGCFSKVEVVLRSEVAEFRSRAETFARDDVAKHFGNPAVLQSGFKVDIATASIKAGKYIVELHGETSQGSAAVAMAFNLIIH